MVGDPKKARSARKRQLATQIIHSNMTREAA
jgi:hypothetical protein